MKNQTITLTESDLRDVVKETVGNLLKEGFMDNISRAIKDWKTEKIISNRNTSELEKHLYMVLRQISQYAGYVIDEVKKEGFNYVSLDASLQQLKGMLYRFEQVINQGRNGY